jgi:hypothetical protein
MVFKPSFKCFKNEKINLSQAFLKLETLLFQNMFILFYHIYRAISTQTKKKWSGNLKNMPIDMCLMRPP